MADDPPGSCVEVPMKRALRLMIAGSTLLATLLVASPVAATGTGADYGAMVSEHARLHGGFSGDHNPGVMHRGFSGWSGH